MTTKKSKIYNSVERATFDSSNLLHAISHNAGNKAAKLFDDDFNYAAFDIDVVEDTVYNATVNIIGCVLEILPKLKKG